MLSEQLKKKLRPMLAFGQTDMEIFKLGLTILFGSGATYEDTRDIVDKPELLISKERFEESCKKYANGGQSQTEIVQDAE
jgi:hypothetical protein